MLLEPSELRDDDIAGREGIPVFTRGGICREYFDKPRIRGRSLTLVIGHGFDQIVDYLPGALNTLCWDAAPMSIAEQVSAGLGKQYRICSFGHAGA
jgi:hypothetical protein